MKNITATIPAEYLEKIDTMVAVGLYEDRDKAIKDAVKRFTRKRKEALTIREEAFSKIRYY